MIRLSQAAVCAVALLTLAACATAEVAPAPLPPPPPPPVAVAPAPPPVAVSAVSAAVGETAYNTRCAGCHSGSGRAPGKDNLAARDPNAIVAALTTGRMASQGAGLSTDEKKSVALYLTGKAPS